MTRPTWDQMKAERDGHTSFGTHNSKDDEFREGSSVTAYGYNEAGELVSVLRSFGPGSGEVEYGERCREAVTYVRTDIGKKWAPEQI